MRARAFAQTCTQAPEEKEEQAKPRCKKCDLECECLLGGGICKLCNARTVCLTRIFGSWPIGPYNELEPAAKTDFWRSGAKGYAAVESLLVKSIATRREKVMESKAE